MHTQTENQVSNNQDNNNLLLNSYFFVTFKFFIEK